jgi:putative hemolysin
VEQFGENEKRVATALIEKYGLSKNLRTLDSMQMAVMKKVGLANIDYVYCADQSFISILEQEGFSLINPEEK